MEELKKLAEAVTHLQAKALVNDVAIRELIRLLPKEAQPAYVAAMRSRMDDLLSTHNLRSDLEGVATLQLASYLAVTGQPPQQ